MASDESMNILSCMQEDEYDHDTDDGYYGSQPHNLSRLSMCTSSMYTNEEEDGDDDMRMFMSRLSIESFDGDADEELSDEKESKEVELDLLSDSDSDKEPGCYSLPATPPRRRINRGQLIEVKEYASENEAQKGLILKQKMRKSLRKRRVIRERCVDDSGGVDDDKILLKKKDGYVNNSFSGESEGCGSGGVVMITRPKGGKRPLCMDLEEVKACKDLGFELEHERMLEMPTSCRVSLSGSNLDTSSGGNSPIANWRISSPGDDPRDVKARLKVWAQAVALASASRPGP